MNQKYNEKIAEIVGLSFGDGSLTKRKNSLRYQLRGHIIDDRDHYLDYIIPLFNSTISQPIVGRDVGIIISRKKNQSYGIAIESKEIGKFLNNRGVHIGRKEELPIPEWIKNDKRFLTKFLRGYFDTDGSIFCQKNYSMKKPTKHKVIRIKMATISKKLSDDLMLSLDLLGIKSYYRVQYKNKKNEKTAHHVEICGRINVEKWFEIIGSKNPKHITKFQVWKEFGLCPPFTSLEQRKKFLSGELNPNSFYD